MKYQHGILDPGEYKREYSLPKITAGEVRKRIADQKFLVDRHALGYIRRHWGKKSLREITAYLGINASTVRKHAKQMGLGLLVEKWDLEKVLRGLRRAKRQGLPLSSGEARKSLGQLYRATIQYCGSWGWGLSMAGISYEKVARRAPFEEWSEGRILSEMNDLHREGKDLDYAFIQARHSKLYAAARNHFGSWKAARQAAGLENPRRSP